MNYTHEQLRVIYKALKGANLLGILKSETGYLRQSVWNTFNAPDTQYVEAIVVTGVSLLKHSTILKDYQILTEILN
jgi:hypothetical protein